MTYSSSDLSIYKNLELQSKVSQASAHELIQMLFDGLLIQLKRAKTMYEQEQSEQQDLALQKAINIIEGLHGALSTEVASELPHNLARLYEYMQRQILTARIRDTERIIDEVLSLSETISSGWRDIADKT